MSKATRGRVRTPKVRQLPDETEQRLSSILHEVLLECDASSHRFHSLNVIYSASLNNEPFPMIKALQGELSINIVASIIVSLLFLVTGFLWGKYKERRRKFGRNLEEYDFYPFTVTRENFGEFSLKDFRLGMHYFLKNEDHTAARQLIFIGEQSNVRAQLEPAEQKVYAQLFEKYNGKKIADDTNEYLENYVRLVRLIGKSFPNTGVEILLHNLADPAHSLITLEFGIVGAICINIDANYITEEVLKDRQRIETWFQNFLRTEMQLDENILSKDEYAKALKGQRHFKDDAF